MTTATIEIIETSKDGCKRMKFENCEFWVNPFGVVMNADDWAIVRDLVNKGLIAEEHSAYNHTTQIVQ